MNHDYFRQTFASHAVLNALMEVEIYIIDSAGRAGTGPATTPTQRESYLTPHCITKRFDSPNKSIINEKKQLTVIVTTTQRARYRMAP